VSSWALTVGRIRLGGSVAGTVDFDRRLNPNVLHRWRREFRQERGNAFPGNRKQRRPAGLICIRGCHVSVCANGFCGGESINGQCVPCVLTSSRNSLASRRSNETCRRSRFRSICSRIDVAFRRSSRARRNAPAVVYTLDNGIMQLAAVPLL
jgi:transposase-like protein